MKIKRLDIEGFRSLRQVSWEPGDLKVVIGPNGSGKSSLLQFLELISVSAQGRLEKYIQSLGGMNPIVWDGTAPSIKFSLDVQCTEICSDHYELELLWHKPAHTYTINNELLRELQKHGVTKEEQIIDYLVRNNQTAYVYDNEKSSPISVRDKFVLPGESILSALNDAFDDDLVIEIFQGYLSSFMVYQGLRTDKDALIRQSTITRFEKRVESDGQNLISVLHTLYTGDREFKADINAAMKAAFGNDFEELVFPPASDQRIQLRVRWKSLKREQSAADLSDGTLRFLFLLTILASPDPPPVIAIDEPETGLHPSMLPIIAEFAQDAAMRSQVIFTTHSPQFLDAMTEAKPTTTVALWENGETLLRTLPKEELEYWLKGYSLGALFRSGTLEQMG